MSFTPHPALRTTFSRKGRRELQGELDLSYAARSAFSVSTASRRATSQATIWAPRMTYPISRSASVAPSGRRCSSQGRAAVSGSVRRGGATAEVGRDTAQLVIVSAQTIETVRRKRQVGVMGGSSLQKNGRRGGFDPPGDGMGGVQPGDLPGLTQGLGRAGGGIGTGQIGGGLGPVGAAAGQIERVPAKAETAEHNGHDGHASEDHRQPTDRGQAAKKRGGAHRNTRRSSSKWGPSRKVGQSPPQTMATPRSCATAFTASAMRG